MGNRAAKFITITMQLKSIKRTTETELTLTWNDEHVSIFPLRYLRKCVRARDVKEKRCYFNPTF